MQSAIFGAPPSSSGCAGRCGSGRTGAGLDLAGAIEAAITRWMGWTINQETVREIAMPKGLPYLKGFVLYFSLQAHAA